MDFVWGGRPIGQRLLAVLLVLKGLMLLGWHQKKLELMCGNPELGSRGDVLMGEVQAFEGGVAQRFTSPSHNAFWCFLSSWPLGKGKSSIVVFRNEIPSLFVSSAEKTSRPFRRCNSHWKLLGQ